MSDAVLGKYALIRKIAQGGMGDVFLARQTEGIDRLVILKSLRTESAQDPDFVEQFLDEARVAATLNHPNIVSIYDVGEWEGTFWIVMEYIQGEDLARLWYAAAKAGVGLPFLVTVRIVHDAALGLFHAHQACDVEGRHLQIVHRDVSPQNIMVRGDGVTKVVDFGIAKAKNRVTSTQAGLVKGKLQYMSPEQVRGEPLDGKSDQFSLGVVLWEMATGKRLFKAKSELDTLNKILTHAIPKPSSIVRAFPKSLEETVMRMLERDRTRRFANLKDVAEALMTYLDRAPPEKRVKVSDFVNSVVGEQLKQRVADLTPMVQPQRPSSPPATIRVERPSFEEHPSAPEPSAAAQPDTTLVDGAPTDDPAADTSSMNAQIRILRGGEPHVALADFDEVRKEIFFGNLRRDDEISVGDAVPVALCEHHALAHLFDDEGTEAMPVYAEDEGYSVGSDELLTAEGGPTSEGPAAAAPQLVTEGFSDEGAALSSLFKDPAAEMSLLEENFVLGDSSPAVEADEPSGPQAFDETDPRMEQRRVETELVDRTLIGDDSLDEDDDLEAAFGPRRSGRVWIAFGLMLTLAAVPVILYFASPQTFARIVQSVSGSAEEGDGQKAQAALFARLAEDRPAALWERRLALGSATGPVVLAERAMLSASLSMALTLGAQVEGAPSADDLAKDAYTLANQARTAAGGAALSHVAMGYAHLAKGAALELDGDLAQAAQVARNSEATVVAQVAAVLNALLATEQAVAAPSAASIKKARDLLATAQAGGEDARVALASARLAAAQTPPDRAPARALASRYPDDARIGRLLAGEGKVPTKKAPAQKDPAQKDPAPEKPPTGEKKDPAKAQDPAPEKPKETFRSAYLAAEKSRRRGRNRKAIKLYEKALTLKKEAKAYRGMGWAYLDSEETAGAIRAFKTAARLRPSDAEAFLGLAEAYRFAARIPEARAAYEKVLSKNPSREDRVTAENALRALR